MDGSCNGLQHYAALGRDDVGGAAVNLTPSDAPQDVYTAVAAVVARRVEADAAAGVPEARALLGHVDRKLVKQTVMTSVYGVTHVGARGQVAARLRERGWTGAGVPAWAASSYAAKVTLAGLGELFADARGIMAWLGAAASAVVGTGAVVSWHTPLGLPVSQPYRSLKPKTVQTVVQRVVLDGGAVRANAHRAPAQKRRQRAAFPPNFIHALDSTHMMLTAVAAKKEGIAFAGVHDSFWTHAGTAPRLGALLRDAFVDLHSRPLLEDLAAELAAAHPGVALPPLPPRGGLDLERVRESPYFFA
jgi:DNA-directed RNA polymerase